jgi:hypothetical protein
MTPRFPIVLANGPSDDAGVARSRQEARRSCGPVVQDPPPPIDPQA